MRTESEDQERVLHSKLPAPRAIHMNFRPAVLIAVALGFLVTAHAATTPVTIAPPDLLASRTVFGRQRVFYGRSATILRPVGAVLLARQPFLYEAMSALRQCPP